MKLLNDGKAVKTSKIDVMRSNSYFDSKKLSIMYNPITRSNKIVSNLHMKEQDLEMVNNLGL